MRFFIPLFFLTGFAVAQPGERLHALNAVVEYANHSSEEISAVITSLNAYYPSLEQKSRSFSPRYTCPVQQEEYYIKTARERLTRSGAFAAVLQKLSSVEDAESAVMTKCRELDTYHQLEDHKRDAYARAGEIVHEVPDLLKRYHQSVQLLNEQLISEYRKISAAFPLTSTRKAEAMMREQMLHEKQFLDRWNLNFNEQIHTGWPNEDLPQSILTTEKNIEALKRYNTGIPYPASSMVSSFREALESILQAKRNAMDGYNYEARKSDRHSNTAYLDLINYFNGALVESFNSIIKYAEQSQHQGLFAIKFTPLFEIRTIPQQQTLVIKPFEDVPYSVLPVNTPQGVLTKEAFQSLTSYIDYTNATVRQVHFLNLVLNNLRGSANYYRTLSSFEKRGALHFDYKDYQVPLAGYQIAVERSKSLPPAIAHHLNTQAKVLLTILQEMDQLCAAIDASVKERSYERDKLATLFTHIARLDVLTNAWDERKEQFSDDVRRTYDLYPVPDKASAWFVSGKLLYDLTRLDHQGLFLAKKFYQGDSAISISTSAIDELQRRILANEYENMKGIRKLGRSNGLCPYTPYEEIPAISRTLSEKLNAPRRDQKEWQRHAYEELTYLYNRIADNYNKFCELSPAPLLKAVRQVNLFRIEPRVASPSSTSGTKTPEVTSLEPATTTRNLSNADTPALISNTAASNPARRIDTVYIEKRDTIYLSESVDYSRSMDGYATNNLVLLLDVSGSMNAPQKLPLLKQSILDLLSMMRPEDEVSIVVFSGKSRVLLKPTSFRNEAGVRRAIENLQSSGKTDANAGLKLAFKVADENYIRGGNNRIILATDGEFNVSDEVCSLVNRFAAQDIFLSVFNFGTKTTPPSMMKLTTLGKGNFQTIIKGNVESSLIREVKSKKKN